MPELETIGKYEVLDTIGEGGFGVVYKARDPLMERLVAIKVCSSEEEQIRKRFLREAKIAGGLDHPNIVTAFDFGTEQDLPYLVQELLTGEDLRTKIERRDPIEPRTKLDYLVQIAKGLQHAHAQGVLHRDVKPANVRILDDNRVKLMDFGMAKIAVASGTQLTQAGSVLGTAGYFAPEQLMAMELDQRVDIFSFGVLAYELLSYRKAFPGDSFMVVFRQVLHDDPEPIASCWPECPEEIAGMIEKCLRKERDDRFGSFDEILPIIYSILSSASFDRRAMRREREELPEPAATVLKPRDSLATQKAVAPATAEPAEHAVEGPEVGAEALKQAELSAPPRTASSEPAIPVAERVAVVAKLESAASALFKSGAVLLERVFSERSVWILAGAVAAVLLILVIWLVSRPAEVATEADRHAEQQSSELGSSDTMPSPTIPTLAVFVEASPWGEIDEIFDDSGEEIALPERRSTPLLLHLPQGAYVISLSDPRSGTKAVCQVLVGAGTTRPCTIAFPPIDPTDYFKEAGWWD